MTKEKREYTVLGKCIWCEKTKPDVSFDTKPHTIPKRLNAHKIGFDICDSCNNFFGSDDNSERVTLSIDKTLKEFINVHQFLLSNNRNSESWKYFKSQIFHYYHKSNALKLRVDYRKNGEYHHLLTRKFKRGIYNIFLQEYHRRTKNGLDDKFDELRNFVRYDKGEIPLFHLKNSRGVRLTEDVNIPHELSFNNHVLSVIDKYGFYYINLKGLSFYLAVTKTAEKNSAYLMKDSRDLIGNGFAFEKLIEVKKMSDIDFTIQNWG